MGRGQSEGCDRSGDRDARRKATWTTVARWNANFLCGRNAETDPPGFFCDFV